jgi:DNA-binding transcriptional LysR family regulator
MFKQLQPADLNLLRIFSAVCECRGVAAAADRLGVAPSTVSTQLLDLESRLGIILCKRGRGGFSITPEGEHVLTHAAQIFDQMQQFVRDIGALKGSLIGQLTVGVVDNIVTNQQLDFSEVLRHFQTRYPNVQVFVQVGTPDFLEQSVMDRRINIGIGIRETGPPNLIYKKLYSEIQVVCCGQYHPLFKMDSTKIEASTLSQSNWVLDFYEMPNLVPKASPPFYTSYVTNVEATLHLVLAGSHLGTLPKHYIQRWVDEGKIKILLEEELSYTHEISVITHAYRKSDALTSSFLSVVHEMLDKRREALNGVAGE